MNPLLEGNSLLHYKTSHYVAEKYLLALHKENS